MAKRYRVKLRRVRSTHDHLRTDEVEGWTGDLPETGKPFHMCAEPLNPEACVRVVTTTPAATVLRSGGEYTFRTANSTYVVTVLETEDASEARATWF